MRLFSGDEAWRWWSQHLDLLCRAQAIDLGRARFSFTASLSPWIGHKVKGVQSACRKVPKAVTQARALMFRLKISQQEMRAKEKRKSWRLVAIILFSQQHSHIVHTITYTNTSTLRSPSRKQVEELI
jgi:hypothetical protein